MAMTRDYKRHDPPRPRIAALQEAGTMLVGGMKAERITREAMGSAQGTGVMRKSSTEDGVLEVWKMTVSRVCL
jgi:IMP cyclohydrolase